MYIYTRVMIRNGRIHLMKQKTKSVYTLPVQLSAPDSHQALTNNNNKPTTHYSFSQGFLLTGAVAASFGGDRMVSGISLIPGIGLPAVISSTTSAKLLGYGASSSTPTSPCFVALFPALCLSESGVVAGLATSPSSHAWYSATLMGTPVFLHPNQSCNSHLPPREQWQGTL